MTVAKTETVWLTGSGEMGERIRAMDWAATPLGPLADWLQRLRTAAIVRLSSRHLLWIGGGAYHSLLSNHAYIPLLGLAEQSWLREVPGAKSGLKSSHLAIHGSWRQIVHD